MSRGETMLFFLAMGWESGKEGVVCLAAAKD
jgi:hypothetical protein